jgi:hypothetical protein
VEKTLEEYAREAESRSGNPPEDAAPEVKPEDEKPKE